MVHGLSVAEVAKAMGIGRQHLRRRLLRATGMPPRQFIEYTRLRHARYLLQTTDFSAAHIGAMCGYSSSAVFCRAFKRAEGATPMAWRRRSRLAGAALGADD
jgi:AraC-like DNA-binding protein